MTEEFVQFRQVFGLHGFKLHRHLVDVIVKSVWFRQVFGLLRVRFRQVSLYFQDRSLFIFLKVSVKIQSHNCVIQFIILFDSEDYCLTQIMLV